MFFEFSHEAKRTALVSLLERRKEDLRNRAAAGEPSTSSDTTRSALIFDDFEPSASSAELDHEGSAVMTHSVTEPMFTSASSTFLKFKPDQPLHFTFLTIGSRGDVQPYIALAKGLLADGHKVRIATHGEFKEWIEAVSESSHVIGYNLCLLPSTAWDRVRLRRRRSGRADADMRRERHVHCVIPERGIAEGMKQPRPACRIAPHRHRIVPWLAR